jgi:chemotaxis protein methyltransferase CheR
MKDEDCTAFLKWALPRLRMRWPGFRRVRRQVCKRVARRCAELGLAGAPAYRRYLQAHAEEWRRLDRCLHISVSRFYRDRRVFDYLGEQVLPELAAAARARGAGHVTAWSAGCASGEEPYSLGLLWRFRVAPAFPDLGLELVATDIDGGLLERARRACYGATSLKELPGEWRKAAFAQKGALLCLREAYRQGIAFRLQDVRRARPRERFDLVLCRNTAFTYFDEGLQREVLARLFAALRPRGVLILGRRERLPDEAPGFEAWSETHGVYRRTSKR